MTGDQARQTLDFEARAETARLPVRAWLRLFASAALIEREISTRLKARFGVSLARFDYLAQLNRDPESPMTMGELGKCLMVTGGSITGLTDRLEAGGLVRRIANPQDRRSHLIKLTEKGRSSFVQMAVEHADWLKQIFAAMSDRDLEALLAGLDKAKDGVRAAAEARLAKAEEGD
jgi:DNA-binding MarR family transcriptional regulator